MKTWGSNYGLLMVAILASQCSLALGQWVEPVCQYRFDETGTNAVNSGSSDVPLAFFDTSSNLVDLHSADGKGVSGLTEDRCMDNRTATAMGVGGIGGRGVIPEGFDGAASFSSFTLECWFKAVTPIAAAARLLDAGTYVAYAGSDPGNVWLQVNKQDVASGTAYAATNQWVFFAVTYDSTLASDNVVFYRGTTTSPVVPVVKQTLQAGVVTNRNPVGVGNLYYGNFRPLRGEIDNARIFASASGNAGAATLRQLEFLRAGDVAHMYQILLKNPAHAKEGFTFDLSTVSGWNYTVVRSTNLVDWLTLTNFAGNGAPAVVGDSGQLPGAYYRVIAN